MEYIVEEEPDLTLPKGSVHRARLQEVKKRTFQWDGKDVITLEWWWEITQTSMGPDYIGRRVKGECNPKLSSRPGNRFREWSEALLNRELPVGMGVDTDDLIGLEAEIMIDHQPNKKAPERPWEVISAVAPVDNSFDNEPPF